MKKVKVLLVGMLTLMMTLFCFSGCFLYQGKYTAVSYKAGALTLDLDNSDSYIELKGDNVAVVSVDIIIGTIEGEGTWEKKDDGYVLTVSGIEYAMTIDGKTLSVEFVFGTVNFEKE